LRLAGKLFLLPFAILLDFNNVTKSYTHPIFERVPLGTAWESRKGLYDLSLSSVFSLPLYQHCRAQVDTCVGMKQVHQKGNG